MARKDRSGDATQLSLAMNARKRSLDEIAQELKRLKRGDVDERDRLSLIHEISVYQEELVVQNEALAHAQLALEVTRDRFVNLYDFAPIAYLTLDRQGVVRLCNLTAATFFGRSKTMLEGLPLLASVIGPQQKRFADFMRRCRSGDRSVVEGEFTLRTNNGTRHAHILCRPPSPGSPMSTEYFMSLVDVTDQRHLEQERARAAREHAALASRLITIQDDERRRIARNLHDDIGQQVTALRLKLEAAGLAGTDAERLEAIARLQEMIEALDRRLHFVATELRPATLDLGIAAALDQFVQEWSLNFGIPAQFQATNLAHTDLTPETETHVYRVVQEALNNISKHAGAGRVAVLLERRDDGVVVVVEDDGLGFDLDAARDREEGVGLVNMRERAQLIGGELEIETTPGHGTSLFLRFPFPPLRPAGHEGETHAIGVSHWSGNRSGTGPQS